MIQTAGVANDTERTRSAPTWELVELPSDVISAEVVEHGNGQAHAVYHKASGEVSRGPTMELDPDERFGESQPQNTGHLRELMTSPDPWDVGELIPIRRRAAA